MIIVILLYLYAMKLKRATNCLTYILIPNDKPTWRMFTQQTLSD